MFCTSDLQESVSDPERNLRGWEVSHVQADPPPVLLLINLLAGITHRPRDVGHKQRSGHVPWPGTGFQTPLEPVHIRPPRDPWLEERRQATIPIEKPARLPPFSQGVPGDTTAVLPTWQLCFSLFGHVSMNKMSQKKNKTWGADKKIAALLFGWQRVTSGLLGLTEIPPIKISSTSEGTIKERFAKAKGGNLWGALYSAPACFGTY